MGNMKRKLIVSVFVLLSLVILTGNGWSQQIGLPHAFFDGMVETYLDNATGDDLIFLYTSIFSVVYADGTSGSSDSILWSTVTISGAKRNPLATPGTTFTPATLTVSDGTTTYLSATLKNVEFVLRNGLWRLNPDLDINNLPTLNLENLLLNPGPVPSRYIQDLQAALGAQTIAGMTMTLDVFNGDITGDSQSAILEGLLDGVPLITNNPPVANAGQNLAISSEQIATTIVQGTASDADGDTLECRWVWMEGGNENVLLNWTQTNGGCPLNLNTLSFGIGTYTLTLEVRDGHTTVSDTMLLTIGNSAPHGYPGGGGTFEINSIILLTGDVSDFDGDELHYKWLEGSTVLCSGIIPTIAGGTAVPIINECAVSGLSLGTHIFTLQVDDGVNSPDSNDVSVEIIDSTVPTIAPLASSYLLWPPNHIMVNIVIVANAADNSGLPVTLSAMVTSNEPVDGLGDGDTGPDWTVPVIDQNTGTIYLQLRRERSGNGNGRVYRVIIMATDSAGNSSTASLNIGVPHDMSKKK